MVVPAVVDTGANVTGVCANLLRAIGITANSDYTPKVNTAWGQRSLSIFTIGLSFDDEASPPLVSRQVLGLSPTAESLKAVLGMDTLAGELVVNTISRTFKLEVDAEAFALLHDRPISRILPPVVQ